MKPPLRVEYEQASHGERMCLVDDNDEVIAITPGRLPRDKKSAERIKLCVNNHDDIVGALSECADLLEQAKKYSDKSVDTGMAAFYANGAEQARKLLNKIAK